MSDERNMMEVEEHQKLVREMEAQAEAKLADYERRMIELRQSATEAAANARAVIANLTLEQGALREINISLQRRLLREQVAAREAVENAAKRKGA